VRRESMEVNLEGSGRSARSLTEGRSLALRER